MLRGCGGRPREAARRPVARRRPGHLTGRPGLKGAALAGWRTAGRSCAVGSCVRPPPPPPGPLRAGGPRAWGFTARDPLPAPPGACCVPGRPGPGRLVPQRPESKCRLQMRLILRMLLGKAAGCVGLAGGEDGPHGDGGSCGCRGELGHRAGDALPHTPHRPHPPRTQPVPPSLRVRGARAGGGSKSGSRTPGWSARTRGRCADPGEARGPPGRGRRPSRRARRGTSGPAGGAASGALAAAAEGARRLPCPPSAPWLSRRLCPGCSARVSARRSRGRGREARGGGSGGAAGGGTCSQTCGHAAPRARGAGRALHQPALSPGVWHRPLRPHLLQSATPGRARPGGRTLTSAATPAVSEPEGSTGNAGSAAGLGGGGDGAWPPRSGLKSSATRSPECPGFRCEALGAGCGPREEGAACLPLLRQQPRRLRAAVACT